MIKRWSMTKVRSEEVSALSKECGISRLTASVLLSHGYRTYEQAAHFFDRQAPLSSPFDMVDMDKAVERIRTALDLQEKIAIYGDYDCDGVTASALLFTYLQLMGADVSVYIPERTTEGYGMNRDAVQKLANDGVTLIITVDNGISAIEEVDYARKLGVDVVITDHHQPGELLPDAVAVVDPHRKDDTSTFKELAGVGVALKLVGAMDDDMEGALASFSHFAAIGTIGDVVPLVSENRRIVMEGLSALRFCELPGLCALMEQAGISQQKLSSHTVAFSIVPRINAAGRLGSAKLALSLLLSEDMEEAQRLAATLCDTNAKRQAKEQEILSEIEEQLAQNQGLLYGRLLILRGEHWNHGVIGIVAARLLEKYGKPVLLMSMDESGCLRGSARSIGTFHLFEALRANDAFLTQYGGHRLAAGFSLKPENFPAFCAGMEAYAKERFDFMPQPEISLAGELLDADLTAETVFQISQLEPFGMQNEVPVFLIRNAQLTGITPLSGGKHQRLSILFGKRGASVVWFGVQTSQIPFSVGAHLDLAVTTEINEYNGRQSISLKLRDVRPSGFDEERFFNAKGYYEKIRRGEPVSDSVRARTLPTREEIAAVYRFLRQNTALTLDSEQLLFALGQKTVNYCKLQALLDILKEANLLSVTPQGFLELCTPTEKVDLTKTRTYRRLS